MELRNSAASACGWCPCEMAILLPGLRPESRLRLSEDGSDLRRGPEAERLARCQQPRTVGLKSHTATAVPPLSRWVGEPDSQSDRNSLKTWSLSSTLAPGKQPRTILLSNIGQRALEPGYVLRCANTGTSSPRRNRDDSGSELSVSTRLNRNYTFWRGTNFWIGP